MYTKIKNTVSFIITEKNGIGVKLTKHAEELHAGNYKMLMKQIDDDLYNEETYSVHRLENNTVKILCNYKQLF